jgi:hypothetical protein
MSNVSVQKKTTSAGAKRRKAKSTASYGTFTHRVLKQIRPDARISKKSIRVMDSLINYFLERITNAATGFVLHSDVKTLRETHFTLACKACFPPELQKHAINTSARILHQYVDATTTTEEKEKKKEK